MVDIVLDINALRLLLNNEYVDRIWKKCDHIYISKAWRRAYRGIRELPRGFGIFLTSTKKLKNKIHEVSGKSNLPRVIERELRNKGASEDDFDVARVAYDRVRVYNSVILVSDDFHL